MACNGADMLADSAIIESGPRDTGQVDQDVATGDVGTGDLGGDRGTPDTAPDVPPQDPSWLVCVGGKEGWSAGRSLYLDGTGNVYVTGSFGGTVKFGSFLLQEKVTHAWPLGVAFVAKLSPLGGVIWAKPLITGAEDSSGSGIELDGAGNIYVAGSFKGSATVGAKVVKSAGAYDVFLAKLDPAGKPIWFITGGGPQWDLGRLEAIDTAGNAYISGYFKSKATFGSFQLTSKGKEDLFITRVSSAGKVVWVTAAGGVGTDAASDLAIDNKAGLMMTGHFQNEVAFGAKTLTAKGTTSAFVARLDATGKFLWASGADGGNVGGGGIVVDGSGGARLAGSFGGTATFGATTLTATSLVDSYVAGLAKDGSFSWAVRIANGRLGPVVQDGAGASLALGDFHLTAQLGKKTLTSTGNSDLFVARIDAKGNPVGGIAGGGNKQDYAGDLALDNAGNVHVTGSTWSTGTVTFGKRSCTTSANATLLLWKFPASWL